jgi:hypothetical protein
MMTTMAISSRDEMILRDSRFMLDRKKMKDNLGTRELTTWLKITNLLA